MPTKAHKWTAEDLERQATAAAALVDFLRDVDEDDQDLIDGSVEGETDFFETIERALDQIAEFEMMEEALKMRMATLKRRRDRFARNAKFLRSSLEVSLAIANGDGDLSQRPFTLNTPAATVTLSLGKVQVRVDDESALPSRFMRSPPPVVDKEALNRYCLNPPSAEDEVIEGDADDWSLPPGVSLTEPGYQLHIRKV
jgi:hypothetical protein